MNADIDVGDKVLILLPKESNSRKYPAYYIPDSWNDFLDSCRIAEVKVILKKNITMTSIPYFTILFPENSRYGHKANTNQLGIEGKQHDSILKTWCIKSDPKNGIYKMKCFNCDYSLCIYLPFEGFYCYECGY